MEAVASAAVVERARTGSARLVVESLEARIAVMEEAKAVGSLRLGFWGSLVWLGFWGEVGGDWSVSAEVSEAEVGLSVDSSGRGRVVVEGLCGLVLEPSSKSESESARFVAGNSSSSSAEEEELE